MVNKATQSNITVSGGDSESGDTINLTVTDRNGKTVTAATVSGTGGVFSIGNLNLSGLADGTLKYSVTATDAAGNTSAAVTSSAIKDTVPPTVTLTPPSAVNIANQSSTTVSGSSGKQAPSST